MKKMLALLLAAMLLFSLAPAAVAEPTVTELQGIRSASLDPESKNIIFRSEGENYYQMMDAEGNILVSAAEEYTNISSQDGFFKVEKDSDEQLSLRGIIDRNGTVLVPAQYHDAKVLSERWLCGITLTASSEEDCDYKVTNISTGEISYFKIESQDFYFDGQLAGTLDAAVCNYTCRGFGAYLGCRGRDGSMTFYNSKLELSPCHATGFNEYDSNYEGGEWIYIHQGSGQIAFRSDCTLTAEEVDTPYLYQDGKIYDLQGQELAAFPQEYSNLRFVNDGYAISRLDGMDGLVTVTGEELIPAAYDDLSYYADEILRYGYISAEKDGMVGLLDAQGQVVVDFLYPENSTDIRGNALLVENEDGSYTVVSGQFGELPEHYSDVYFPDRDGSLAFVAKRDDGTSGVVDVLGNILVPFGEYYGLEVSVDGTLALVREDGGYMLYRF